VVGLVVGGWTLSSIFRASVEDNFSATLETDLDSLIASTDADSNGDAHVEQGFEMARYERVYSGWYWQIMPMDAQNRDQGTLLSRSLFHKAVLSNTDYSARGLMFGHAEGPDGQFLRTIARRVEFPVTDSKKRDETRAYNFVVAGNLAEVDKRVSDFDTALFWSFLLLGAGLVGAVLLQVRVGLQPLRKVSEALARIRDGKARRLEGEFPAEIQPLASELNSLIEHSQEVVGRARTHVSNLAHFLKTPLTVLSSEAAAQPGPLADAVRRQVSTMRRQVDHYLARARAAGAVDVLGNRTQVKPVLDDLARVLKRMHANVEIEIQCPSALYFRGERQDLEEMAGNLMDNACKWAYGSVLVSAVRGAGATMELTIEDDGDGLSEEERAQVGERGERLDESVPGSGLGLAIVRDISKLYGGNFELAKSERKGGLKARLILPMLA
jgi:signal transduction histidine kinase